MDQEFRIDNKKSCKKIILQLLQTQLVLLLLLPLGLEQRRLLLLEQHLHLQLMLLVLVLLPLDLDFSSFFVCRVGPGTGPFRPCRLF